MAFVGMRDVEFRSNRGPMISHCSIVFKRLEDMNVFMSKMDDATLMYTDIKVDDQQFKDNVPINELIRLYEKYPKMLDKAILELRKQDAKEGLDANI